MEEEWVKKEDNHPSSKNLFVESPGLYRKILDYILCISDLMPEMKC